MKVLLIEDNHKTAHFLSNGLTEQGFVVDVCDDGETGLEQALAGNQDIIVMDVMLPLMDGWSVLQKFRQENDKTPVLMLTARSGIEHRVRGLSLGADDYLVKPFAFAELLARIQSLLRRRTVRQSDVLQFADLTIDVQRHRVERAGKSIDLTTKEFLLLSLLVENQGMVLSRTLITESVWDINFDCDSNVVDVHIRRLRSKVDDPFEHNLIHTIRGRGYVVK